MAAYFSPDTPTCSGGFCLLQYVPQISNPSGNVLSDTVNWTLISGSFTAAGGERFITIGNFLPDSLITIDSFPVWTYPDAYYYIDDVFTEEMQVDTANAGGDKTVCEGESAQLGTAPCGGCLYQWQNVNGSLNDTALAQPIASPTQTTTYVLMMRDTSTGTICDWTSTDTITVTVIPFAPQVADAGIAQTLCKGESVMLGTAPCGNCTYQWQPFGSLSNATVAQPTASPAQTTTYLLTMTDSVPPCAKTTTDTVTVFVESCTEPVEVPNLFTPNGDTKNEVFQIKNLPANSSIQIFNRWGSRVYESGNYLNNWDGGGVPDGTYFYLLSLPDKKAHHGFIEIRR